MFTAKEKLDALSRELVYRHRVYARRVEDGKMTKALAEKQIALFQEIRDEYAVIAEKERLL